MKHCKAPLDVIAHKVSTSYIYIYIIQLTPCMLSIHRIFFLIKVGSEARTGGTTTADTMFASSSWRTQKELPKRTSKYVI